MQLIGLAVTLALCLALAPLAAWSQTARTYRVAMLEPFATVEGRLYREAFLAALRELGYVEGRNLILHPRTSDRDRTLVPTLADELIALKPDVLVSDSNAVRILRQTDCINTYRVNGPDGPVGDGLALSLARPGLNVTGIALLQDQLFAKQIELMREILPRLTRVGMLVDRTSDDCRVVESSGRQASRTVGAVFVDYRVANRQEIGQAFSRVRTQQPDVLLPCPAALLFNNRDPFLLDDVSGREEVRSMKRSALSATRQRDWKQ